jgi:nucleoside-diphosphate kinase
MKDSAVTLERTLVIIKPDGVRRALVGEILLRLERAGLKLIGLKLTTVDKPFAERHYRKEDIAARHGERIWLQLLDYITEGPVVAAAIEGSSAVAVVRKLCGSTEPKQAAPGTIRGDFSHHGYDLADAAEMAVRNVIHASATAEEGEAEVSLWFTEDELSVYSRSDDSDHFFNRRHAR